MESSTETNTPNSSSKQSFPMGLVAVGLIVVVGIGAAVYKYSMKSGSTGAPESAMEQTTVSASSSPTEVATFKDGTYDVVGQYTSPGGPEEIDVKITLKDNIVTEAEVVSKATLPKSQFMQAAFIDGFKDQVIGKNINEIQVTKVAGSSLTPQGFNDALEKVKAQAKV